VREPNPAQARDDDGTTGIASSEPQGGVGKPEAQPFGRKGELASRALQCYPFASWAGLSPQRHGLPSQPDAETPGVQGEHQDLTSGNGHDPRTVVSRYQVIGRRPYFDPIEGAGQAGNRNPEQQSNHCKDQHQFWEAKALSHAAE
jgi:hypothetical protein